MDQLLRTKLAIPRQAERRIVRPRLTALLDGARDARLVLLSAPPGFGKTTALVDWRAAGWDRRSWPTPRP